MFEQYNWQGNTGFWLKQPNESSYSLLQRFVVANPGWNYGALVHRLTGKRHTNGETIRKILSVIKHEEYQRFGYKRNYSTLEGNVNKQCPECAKLYFHSELFNNNAVKTCPVHLVQLTALCPNCHCCWPTFKGMFTRNCDLCNPNLTRLFAINTDKAKHMLVFSKIQEIYKELSANLNENNIVHFCADIDKRKITHTNSNFLRKSKLLTSNPIWQHATFRGLNQSPPYLNHLYKHKFCQKSLYYRKCNHLENTVKIFKKPWELKLALRAIEIVSKYLCKLNKLKTISLLEYSDHNIISHKNIYEDCPYSIAFTIWFDTVVTFAGVYPYASGIKGVYDPLHILRSISYDNICLLHTGDHEYVGKPNADPECQLLVLRQASKSWLNLRLMLLNFVNIFNAISIYRRLHLYKIRQNRRGFYNLPDWYVEHRFNRLVKFARLSQLSYHLVNVCEDKKIQLLYRLDDLKVLKMPQAPPQSSQHYNNTNTNKERKQRRLDSVYEPLVKNSFLSKYIKLIAHRTRFVKNFSFFEIISLVAHSKRFVAHMPYHGEKYSYKALAEIAKQQALICRFPEHPDISSIDFKLIISDSYIDKIGLKLGYTSNRERSLISRDEFEQALKAFLKIDE